LKPEWWGSQLAQEEKYQGRKKTCNDDDDNNNNNKSSLCGVGSRLVIHTPVFLRFSIPVDLY
jgi:hypothetical protein